MPTLPSLVRRLVLSVLGGVVLAVCFPPFDVGLVLLPLGVALMALAVHGASARVGALVGLVGGLTFLLILLRWLSVVGTDAWLLVTVACAAFFAAQGAATALVTRLAWWPLWVAFLWVAQEAFRGRTPFGGFPWGRLAFGDQELWFAPWASVGGAPLVTFLVALSGSLAAWAVLNVRSRAMVAVGALALSVAVPATAVLVPVPTSGALVTVALVQGNVPRSGLDFLGQRRAVLNNHVNATLELADEVRAGRVPQPDLVIWPENSTDIDPFDDPSARAQIDGAVKTIGVPVLVGAVIDAEDGERVENAGIVWDPRTGPGERYTKQHLVPFGEYVPLRWLLDDRVTRLGRVAKDFKPGTEPGVLDVGPATLADVICFEIAFDDVVRGAVRGGGQAVVVQTNNATYGRTGQPEQQALIGQVRALEHGRPVLVAATSGISQVVDADGSVRVSTREFEQRVLVEQVALRSELTLAARAGAAPELVLTIVGLAAVVAALVARRRSGTGRRGDEQA